MHRVCGHYGFYAANIPEKMAKFSLRSVTQRALLTGWSKIRNKHKECNLAVLLRTGILSRALLLLLLLLLLPIDLLSHGPMVTDTVYVIYMFQDVKDSIKNSQILSLTSNLFDYKQQDVETMIPK